MTEYRADRFIADTVMGDPNTVDAWHVPTPPPEWGPGVMVRVSEHRGWQWTPPPDPRDRWEPAQPPAESVRPIAVLLWARADDKVGLASMRLARDEGCVRLRVADCDVASWDEPRPRPKPTLAEFALMDPQAKYLRDALTHLLKEQP